MSEDTNFLKILTALRAAHKAHPDIRFGAMLQTAIDKATIGTNHLIAFIDYFVFT